ncbi:hypothetical protein C8Q74DRAFT_984974 [Fomes fomentarius]|nr:hypothetical protein C8Q74DRAFT_984974 [Fomes fomentarius]
MLDDSILADAASIGSDSDHSNSSLPDFAQIVATQARQLSRSSTPQPSTSKTLTPRSLREPSPKLAESIRGGKSPNPKEEIVEQELPLTPVTAPSPRKTRSSTRKAPSQDRSPPTATFSEGKKTGVSSATSALPSSSSTPKSTHRENKRGAHELAEGVSQFSPSFTQPTKRARHSQLAPPPATQPLPRPVPLTPSHHTPASVHPPSTFKPNGRIKDKGKQNAITRKRSENFWHLDGSVVVQVQNTLFRLHRSRLTSQSDYFSALFRADRASLSTSSDSAEEPDVVDSCPLYVAKGVSVLDFERLLTALDAGIAYASTPPPFPVLASLLRAAHTLKFTSILSFATHLLRTMWPQDLAQLTAEPRSESHAVETILLAQQCDVPEVLKSAYFELLRTPNFGQDVEVYVVHADPSPSQSQTQLEIASEDDETHAPPPRLAASDLVRLVRAKEAMQAEWLALMRVAPLPSAFPCPLSHLASDNSVSLAKQKIAQDRQKARRADGTQWPARLLEASVFEAGFADVFRGLEMLVRDVDWAGAGYCAACVGERRDAWGEMRVKLWKRLDVLLGLRGEGEE